MKWTPRRFKFLMNLYGPFRGAAIRIDEVQEDWHSMVVSMRLRWYNRNMFGTHFGGSLYAMVDAPFVIMLTQILGRDYFIWDKSAHIDFVKPGRGTVKAIFTLTPNEVETVRQATEAGDKYLPTFHVRVTDAKDETVANISKTIYVKKKPRARPSPEYSKATN